MHIVKYPTIHRGYRKFYFFAHLYHLSTLNANIIQNGAQSQLIFILKFLSFFLKNYFEKKNFFENSKFEIESEKTKVENLKKVVY